MLTNVQSFGLLEDRHHSRTGLVGLTGNVPTAFVRATATRRSGVR
jgi:hypothetical protein